MTKKHTKRHEQLLQSYFGESLSKQEENELKHNIKNCDICRLEFEKSKEIENILKTSKPFLKPFYDLEYKEKIQRFQKKQKLAHDICGQFIEENISGEKDIFEIAWEATLEFVTKFKGEKPKNWKLKPLKKFATSLSFTSGYPEFQLSSPYIILAVLAIFQYLYELPSEAKLSEAESIISEFSQRFISSDKLREKFKDFLLSKTKKLF